MREKGGLQLLPHYTCIPEQGTGNVIYFVSGCLRGLHRSPKMFLFREKYFTINFVNPKEPLLMTMNNINKPTFFSNMVQGSDLLTHSSFVHVLDARAPGSVGL